MKVQVENQEKNMAKLTIEVDEAAVEKALDTIYQRKRKSISVPGFRKGKVPRVMIERMYGPEIFYEDAVDLMISEEYPNAYDESGVDIVSKPEIDVVQIEKGKPFIFTALVALRPDVNLGKYKGLSVTKVSTTVTKKEIEAEIEKDLKNNSRMETVDREAKNGDTVVIDYEGKVDGVAFEGGKAEGHNLELGSKSFIDTFEEQIEGHKAGDEFDVNVTFPKEYHAKDLAGKPAVFSVKLNEVREKQIPELDDEYVQDTTECDTVDEYRDSVKKRLSDIKKQQAKMQKETEVMDKLIESIEVELPEPMVETQIDQMINDYSRNLAQSGMTLDNFMQATGSDMNGLREQLKEDAIKQIKGSLSLEAVVKAENIEASEKDVDERIEEMSKMYGMDPEEMKKSFADKERDRLKKDIAIEKALDFLVENAKEQAKSRKKTDKEDEKGEKKEVKKEKKTTKKTDKEEKKTTKKSTKSKEKKEDK